MLSEIKSVVRRSKATLLQDAIGGVALMVGLIGVLYLPGVL